MLRMSLQRAENFLSTRPPLTQCSLASNRPMDNGTIGFALRCPAIRIQVTRRTITVTVYDRTSILRIRSLVCLLRPTQSSLGIPPSSPGASRRRLNVPSYRLLSTIALLVGAVSASKLRVDNAAAAARRASRGRATVVRRTGSARAEDRLRVTDGFLYVCQMSARDWLCCIMG